MKELKVAVCLFGQPRTGLYCAPYIKESYNLDGHEVELTTLNKGVAEKELVKISVEYFCSTKDYNTNGMVVGKTYGEMSPADPTEIDTLVSMYNPVKSKVISYDKEPKFDKNLTHNILGWDWPKSFLHGIVSAINLKKEYELDCGWRYDLCFCQRFDAITSPVSPAGILIKNVPIRKGVVYSHWITRFAEEDNSLGIGDFWFGGDSLSMDLMASSLTRYLSNSTKVSSDINESYVGVGPNVLLYNAFIENNVYVDHFPGGVSATPVRPESDLTTPVMESYHSHLNFFTKNHPANQ